MSTTSPDLGPTIWTYSNRINRIFLGVFGLLFASFFGWSGLVSLGASNGAVSPAMLLGLQTSVVVACVVIVVASAYSLARFRDRFVFYEQGVELRRGERVVSRFRYDAADEFRLKLTRHIMERRYLGTTVVLSWRAGGRQTFRARVGFMEVYVRAGFFGRYEFSSDLGPVGRVRDLAAAAITPRFVRDLSQGGSFELANGHIVSTHGISLARAFGKPVHAPYEEIESMIVVRDELVILLISGDTYTCTSPGPNFWPKFQTVQAFWLAKRRAGNPSPSRGVEIS